MQSMREIDKNFIAWKRLFEEHEAAVAAGAFLAGLGALGYFALV